MFECLCCQGDVRNLKILDRINNADNFSKRDEKNWCCVVNFLLLSLRYAVLRDPAGWLSVNPVRGTVNTSASLDRESPYVQDNKYTAVFIATDNGEFQIPHCMRTLSLSLEIDYMF